MFAGGMGSAGAPRPVAGARGRTRRPAAPLRLALAVLLVAVGTVWATGTRAGAEGECRIAGGHATVKVTEGADSGAVYEGAMFLVVEDCPTGPKTLAGTFEPLGGTPATCDPGRSVHGDQAVCTVTASAGVAPPGTPVVVTATAEVVGVVSNGDWIGGTPEGREQVEDDISGSGADPQVARATSVCVVALPEIGGRLACTLF